MLHAANDKAHPPLLYCPFFRTARVRAATLTPVAVWRCAWVGGANNVGTVQTLYHRAKILFFALRGGCAHEKYLFILGVRD